MAHQSSPPDLESTVPRGLPDSHKYDSPLSLEVEGAINFTWRYYGELFFSCKSNELFGLKK